jgi:YHS domain-containing protein
MTWRKRAGRLAARDRGVATWPRRCRRTGCATQEERAMQTKGDDASFDPICGKRVDPVGAQAVEYKKRKYFFCSGRCRERFERQAERHRVQDLARLGALFARQKVRWGLA